MNEFAQWGDFHDFTLSKLVVDFANARMELILVPQNSEWPTIAFEFLGFSHAHLSGFQLQTVIDEIHEIPRDQLSTYPEFSQPPGNWSLQDAVDACRAEDSRRLWIVRTSVGLQIGVLGGEVRVTPLTSGTASEGLGASIDGKR